MNNYDLINSILEPICKKIFMLSSLPRLNISKKEEQEQILEGIKKEMAGKAGITCGGVEIHKNYYSKKQTAKFNFQIASLRPRINAIRCTLDFDEFDYALIEIGYNKKYFFNNVSQIFDLRDAIQQAAIIADKKYEIAESEALKKEKIKDLKKKAIIAKALELVKLENVPYIIDDSFATKIVIFIRLSDAVRLEVNVPYSNYQIVLQNTQAAIQAIRLFVDKGIAINVRTSAATTPYYEWQKPN